MDSVLTFKYKKIHVKRQIFPFSKIPRKLISDCYKALTPETPLQNGEYKPMEMSGNNKCMIKFLLLLLPIIFPSTSHPGSFY